MRHIKASDLRGYVESIQKSTTELIKEASSRARPHVFLSHSHLDRAALGGVLALLDRYRAPAYLDYRDATLPSQTSSATADGLRAALDSCARVIVAASGQLRTSRWVPWEIGYADGSKGIANVALMPIDLIGYSVGIEQEYLDSYPKIVISEFRHRTKITVFDPRDQRGWNIEDWLFGDIE
jgi:hypothetical protein